MLKIAVTGANGFVGTRLIERWHLTGCIQVMPVVRSYASLARTARFDLEYRIADGRDQEALTEAFKGCDIVVDAMLIETSRMPESAQTVYLAAEAAGVKRLIYLSSASVYGQAPKPGADENTALSIVQPFPYNTAKVKSERNLYHCRKLGSTELVVLRPGIVYGPRSRWISNIAEELLQERAYLFADGQGICNGIYIDNLIEAIELCTGAHNIDGQAFIVADQEEIHWVDLYTRIARALNIDQNTIQKIDPDSYRPDQHAPALAEKIRASAPVQALLPLVPGKLKLAAKAAIKEIGNNDQAAPVAPHMQLLSGQRQIVQPSAEMALLQQCRYKLPDTKARALLGYKSHVSFSDGCRRSIDWLSFAGYPVKIPK